MVIFVESWANWLKLITSINIKMSTNSPTERTQKKASTQFKQICGPN